MKKKLAIICASSQQIRLVNQAKEMGVETHCFAWDKEGYTDCKGIADYFHPISIFEKEQISEICKELNIDGVMSNNDMAFPTVAYVAKHLNLPSLSIQDAALYTNKYLMRNFCKENGFLYPPYMICKNVEEAKTFFEKNNKNKMIIKPLDSSASKGVNIINNVNDLDLYFPKALSISMVEKAVLAEHYIEGTEFTVDGITFGGKHYSLAISKKKHYEYNPNVANELFFSHTNPRFDYQQLRTQNNQLVEATRLADGCLTHAEYKFEDGKFWLIEITARGGGYLSPIVRYMSGIDTAKFVMESALGINSITNISPNLSNNRFAVLSFLDMPAQGGYIASVEGLDEIKNMDHLLRFGMEYKIGDYIKKIESDNQRVGFYIAVGDTRAEVKKVMDTVNKIFKINFSENPIK